MGEPAICLTWRHTSGTILRAGALLMIVIIGVTRRLGKAVAERLLRDGISFRGACCNVAKAQSLADRGVEIVALDLETGAGLAQALSGMTKVVSCVHGLLGQSRASIDRIDIQGQSALIDAAAKAGLERFVFISALGASPHHPAELWRAKARAEQHLKASGMKYVILRPSAFMDLYAHDLVGAAILGGKPAVVLGSGKMARNMIAVEDVAAAAVTALVRDDLTNVTIEIGGWESLNGRDIAATYASLSGGKAKLYAVPPLALRALASLISPFHAGIGHLLRLPLQLVGREDLHLDASSWTALLGIDPIRLEDFAAQKLLSESERY